MSKPKLEVADVFRRHGGAWRTANAAHVSLTQRRIMTAIEICRTAALGGHVERCEDCAHTRIAYNSCRNRHCPKCQRRAAERWLAAREAELLPVPYYHVVFTLPAEVGAIAYQNKAAVYGLLFKAAARTLMTIAADAKHLGAAIGLTACCTAGARTSITTRISIASFRVAASPPTANAGYHAGPVSFCSVRVLSRLFRRLFLEGLVALFETGQLQFFNELASLSDRVAFLSHLAPLRKREWVVYAKRPFAGPEQVLAYLARYTHRVAIANSRLVEQTDEHVVFRWKDYRENGRSKNKIDDARGRRVHPPLPASRLA